MREAGDEQLSQRVRSLRLPQQKAAAPGKRWLLGTACVLLIAGGAAFGYVWINRPSAPSPTEAAPVDLNAAAESASGEFALESKGYVIPAHQILVSPKVSGMIVKMRITESQRVVKNEILAELEDIDYRADWERAKANLAQSRARLARCVLDLSRAKELLPKNAISQSDYDLALGAHDEAAATVKLAEAELAKAKWMLDNCIIRAPISGTILKKNAEEGKPRQSDRVAGLLQPVRNGRPRRLGDRPDHPGARHQPDLQGPEVQDSGRGLPRSRV